MKNENKLLDYIANNTIMESQELNINNLDHTSWFKTRIKEINQNLTIYGLPELGDLFSTSSFQINKTLEVIQKLLADRQKNFESRAEFHQKISKNESEIFGLEEKI